MNIKLLQDYVLVLPDKAEEKTKAGIIIPDTAKEKPNRGTIVAVGKGIKDEPMELKEGDVIYYGKYSGTEISKDGVDYMLMHQKDVYCVIEGNE